MLGRKRERSEAELELVSGRLLRLFRSTNDVFLQLFDGGARVKHTRLPRQLMEAPPAHAVRWAAAQAQTWAEADELSSEFVEAIERVVAARQDEPQTCAQGLQEQLTPVQSSIATSLECEWDGSRDDAATVRAVFTELGEEIGRAAFNAAAAARSSSGISGEQQRRGRTCNSMQRFDPVHAERGRGGWSQYDLGRVGRRHGRVLDLSYDELRADARQLREHMDSLCNMLKMPNRNFNVVLEHIAAVMLHQAAVHEKPDSDAVGNDAAGSDAAGSGAAGSDAAGSDMAKGDAAEGGAATVDETKGAASGDDVQDQLGDAAAGVATRGGAVSDYAEKGGVAVGAATKGGAAGRDEAGSDATSSTATESAAAPSEPMTFSSHASCAGTACRVDVRSTGIRITQADADGELPVDGVPRNIPFNLVIDITSSQTPQVASCLVKMASIDKPVCLSFHPRSAFDAIQRTHVKARDKLMVALQHAHTVARASRRGSNVANGSSLPQKESARVRKGRELRELLREVSKLHSAGHRKEAAQLMEAAEAGSTSNQTTDSLVKKRSQQLRSELFTYGGMELTRSILREFLKLSEVRLLLPEHTRQAQKEAADSQTARELLQAAARFIHEVLGTRGRRSDKDRNAFWASVVSLMPRELKGKRKVASAMRLLQVPRRVINRALDMRGELEDRAQGWRRIVSNGHKDKVDGAIISEAWHSELLSSEDNMHKRSYAVYCGECDGEEQYDIHQRRAQHGTDKDALQRFKGSEFEAKLREATKTANRPQGVGGSLKLLRQYKCVCIKKRSASECDCKICTLVDVLLRRWHGARHGWRTSWRKAADGSLFRPPRCQCFICADDERLAAFMQVCECLPRPQHPLLCSTVLTEPHWLSTHRHHNLSIR